MKLSILIPHLILAAAAVFAGPSHAQRAPQADVTLDVCQDLVTGNYRYSGVVAVRPDTPAAEVSASYVVQNRTSEAGYADALALAPLAVTASAESGARLAIFEQEAAPLTLGTLRSAADIQVVEGGAAPVALQATYELTAAVCGCQVRGCVRTQGYWGNKPGVVWPAPLSRTASFFSSGLTWQQIMDSSARGGNAYVILAHQYIAARLNIAGGATAPSSIQTVLAKALTWFSNGTTLASCGGSECATQKAWAGMLDTYNNGQYPGAPKSCP